MARRWPFYTNVGDLVAQPPPPTDEELVMSFERWAAGMPCTNEQVVNACRAIAQELRKRGLFGEVLHDMEPEAQNWLIDNRI